MSIKAALAAKPTTTPGLSESLCMYPRPEDGMAADAGGCIQAVPDGWAVN